jgi:D-glycero-alpha-D-manno-heptose 1-phosphate guanylyltransferase
LEAIVLAGGFGTRLQSVVNDVPKSMALVNNRPFLEYLLDYLAAQGIQKVVLSVGYKHEIIVNHFGDRYKSVSIDYAIENEPLGTGGGIRLALWKTEGPRALVMNGDTMFKVNYQAMLDFHLAKKADATLALFKRRDTARFGLVKLNRTHRITGFLEKSELAPAGFINGGVYIIEKKFLMEPGFRGRFSIEKDCFELYFNDLRLFGFASDGYFHDIGIPGDYQKAQDDFAGFEN